MPLALLALAVGAFGIGTTEFVIMGLLVIAAGHGYTAPNAVGAALAASALVLAVVSAALERRTPTAGRPWRAVPTASVR
ncbi:hypothetical protein ACIQ7D_32490 [Streptomyces sp. NPDC096310]|uniref:hypothetical protein n=1 Tax=Streptomyces sp. NPDC096310 TaxID=3366082 RepID=UPI0037FF7030